MPSPAKDRFAKIHDAEIGIFVVRLRKMSMCATLCAGLAFGGAEETGSRLHAAGARSARSLVSSTRWGRRCCLAAAARRSFALVCGLQVKVPFTVHLTIGGDIAHFHPRADGAALGATSHTDFRLLAGHSANEQRRGLSQHWVSA